MGVSAYSQEDKVIIFPPTHTCNKNKAEKAFLGLALLLLRKLDRPPGIHEEKEAH